MKIHRDCDSLSIWSFYKIIETNDFRFLLVDINSIKELSKEQNILCSLAFKQIVDEYIGLSVTLETLKNYKAQMRLKGMRAEYDIIINILQLFEKTAVIDILTLLPSVKIPFNPKRNVDKQVKSAIRLSKSRKNKINIAQLNYDARFKKKVDVNQAPFNLEKEALRLGLALKMSQFIDTREMVISRWLNLIDISLEK